MPQEHSDQCKGCGTAADIAADADDLAARLRGGQAAIDRFAVEVERNGFPFWHKNKSRAASKTDALAKTAARRRPVDAEYAVLNLYPDYSLTCNIVAYYFAFTPPFQ